MPEYKFVPLVMLTTETKEEKKRQGKAAGASGWIVKPITPEQLLNAVKKFTLNDKSRIEPKPLLLVAVNFPSVS